MLNPADVLNIECKFVERMVNLLTRRKAIVDICPCEVTPYFADAQLVTLLEDCLEYSDECALKKKADSYVGQNPKNPGITPCADQVDISLTKTTTECSNTAAIINNSGIYPKIVIYNNEIYHDAYVNTKFTFCDGSSQQVPFSVGITNGSYNDNQRVAILMTFAISNPVTNYPGGYIQTLRLYTTDASGVLSTSPMDLDVSPGNVAH